MRRPACCVLLLALLMSLPVGAQPDASAEPLRLGMAGLVHGHASGFLNRYLKRADVQLVGIAEPDQSVTSRYRERFGLDPERLFTSIEQMLDQARPQAVVVFADTLDRSSRRHDSIAASISLASPSSPEPRACCRAVSRVVAARGSWPLRASPGSTATIGESTISARLTSRMSNAAVRGGGVS